MYDARATRVMCGDRDKVSHLSGDTRDNKKNLIRNWQRVLGVYNIKYVHLCIHAHIYIYAYLLFVGTYSAWVLIGFFMSPHDVFFSDLIVFMYKLLKV